MPRHVLRWRTIKPRKDVYIHVAVVPADRGVKTVARHVRYVGKPGKVKRIGRGRSRRKRKGQSSMPKAAIRAMLQSSRTPPGLKAYWRKRLGR